MKKNFVVAYLLLLFPSIISSQENKIYFGLEMGILENWNTKPNDEVGVFINSQYYITTIRQLFQKAYVTYESKYGVSVDFFHATYSDLICARGNISIDPNVRDCSGSDWNAYQINSHVYRKIYPFNKRLFIKPSVGLGFMWYGGDSYSVGDPGFGSTRGSFFNYYYDHYNTYFRNKNILVNGSIALGYKVNPRLNFIVHFNYQQGIFKMYHIDIVAWKPDDYDIYELPTDPSKLMDVQYDSRGSNSHFGIGAEIYLMSIQPKNKK